MFVLLSASQKSQLANFGLPVGSALLDLCLMSEKGRPLLSVEPDCKMYGEGYLWGTYVTVHNRILAVLWEFEQSSQIHSSYVSNWAELSQQILFLLVFLWKWSCWWLLLVVVIIIILYIYYDPPKPVFPLFSVWYCIVHNRFVKCVSALFQLVIIVVLQIWCILNGW